MHRGVLQPYPETLTGRKVGFHSLATDFCKYRDTKDLSSGTGHLGGVDVAPEWCWKLF